MTDSQESRTELKACPFCGEAASQSSLGAWCDNDSCAIVGTVFSGGIGHWNHRAPVKESTTQAGLVLEEGK
jgi:hypothetical protein